MEISGKMGGTQMLHQGRNCFVLLAVLLAATISPANDKNVLTKKYEGAFLVPRQEGLVIFLCHAPQGTDPSECALPWPVHIFSGRVDYKNRNATNPPECGVPSAVPLLTSDLLTVGEAGFMDKRFYLQVNQVKAVQFTCGIGNDSHEAFVRGQATFLFNVSNPKDVDAFDRLVQDWLQPATEDELAKAGQSQKLSSTHRIALGMTMSQVEEALGPPNTRVDLSDKVLYKYKDTTIEFRNGKVADVR